VETFKNKDWFEPEMEEHGTTGPLVTAPHDPAPISKLILDSLQSKGLPLKHDMFTTGESAHGCGHAVRSISEGVRTCSTDYLRTEKAKAQVTILSGQYVDMVIADSEGDTNNLRATGVRVIDKNGASTVYEAKKEVILTAGTYGTPAILLRSGIGPSAELKELNITPKLHLPGVGKNLMDHLV
jgi:choline dehydrogenase-like flavoprotein